VSLVAGESGLALARACLAGQDFGRVPALLAPFIGLPHPPSFDVFFFTGLAYQKGGNYLRALEVFTQAPTFAIIPGDVV
jgi:hypothetical protein